MPEVQPAEPERQHSEPAVPREPSKRERLIAAARDEIHRRGYAATTLAVVAEASGVPLGNVYYYFKTKDDLIQAVIEDHTAHVDALLEACSQADDPLDRVRAFIDHLEENRDDVAQHGCPIGCLNQELEKAESRFEGWAEKLFTVQLDWLEAQFGAAGSGKSSRDRAVHVLASAQGASLVCQSMGDPAVLERELALLRAWLETAT